MPRHLTVIILSLVCTLGLAACEPPPAPEPTVTIFMLPTDVLEEVETTPTLSDVLADEPELSTLNAAVEAAGIAEQLEAAEAITVFAPTDSAFAALPDGALDLLLATPTGDLTDVLQQHIVARNLSIADVAFNTSLVTLLGENLIISEDTDGTIRVGGAVVTVADLQIENGTVHIIDQVLETSEVSFETSIADVIADRTTLTTLSSALELANLTDTLDGDIEYTILAPSNTAFDGLPMTLLEELDADPVRLAEVLSYHIVPGRLSTEALTQQRFVETIQGQTLYLTTTEDALLANGLGTFIESDIEASNGLVHIVDLVMLPADYESDAVNTIAETVGQRPEFSTLLAAVLAAGYGEEFQAPGQYTLLAPTNQAFANLPAGTLDDLLANPVRMREVLLYHTLPGVFTEGDITSAISLPTLTGVPITVDEQPFGSEVLLNGTADLQLTNIRTNNGMVHQVDQVLLPPERPELPTTAEVVSGDEQLSTLNDLIEQAGLSDTIADADNITLFAPTNAAFEALPAGTVDLLLDGPEEALERTLLYHVINQRRTQAELEALQLLPTLAGSPVLIFEENNALTINGATFNMVDIETQNGVVHIIDAVILPPNPTDIGGTSSVERVIAEQEELSIFSSAIDQGRYSILLTGQGPFTVFAPTDEAFEALSETAYNALFANPPESLRPLLLDHITLGAFQAEQLFGFNQILMASGLAVPIEEELIGTATVIEANLAGNNGTIHIIDQVLSEPVE